jgi:hypothetical protein
MSAITCRFQCGSIHLRGGRGQVAYARDIRNKFKATRVNFNREKSEGPLVGALAGSRSRADEVRGAC